MQWPPLRSMGPWLLSLVILGALLVQTMRLLAPLAEALILAVSLAILSGPTLLPLWRRAWGWLPVRSLRPHLAAWSTVISALLLAGSPVLGLLISSVASLGEATQLALGLVLREPERLAPMLQRIEHDLNRLSAWYPALDLDPAQILNQIKHGLQASDHVGTAALGLLFRGSGQLALFLLAVLSWLFVLVHGHRGLRTVLELTPLTAAQVHSACQRACQLSRAVVLGHLGEAALKGLGFALLAWLTAAPVPLGLVALLAGLLSLLPLAGTTLVWGPLSLSALTLSGWPLALSTAGLGLAIALLPGRLRRKMQGEAGVGLDFALFLAVIGGLIALGPSGLVVGPATVVVSLSAWDTLRGSLLGSLREQAQSAFHNPEPPSAPT